MSSERLKNINNFVKYATDNDLKSLSEVKLVKEENPKLKWIIELVTLLSKDERYFPILQYIKYYITGLYDENVFLDIVNEAPIVDYAVDNDNIDLLLWADNLSEDEEETDIIEKVIAYGKIKILDYMFRTHGDVIFDNLEDNGEIMEIGLDANTVDFMIENKVQQYDP